MIIPTSLPMLISCCVGDRDWLSLTLRPGNPIRRSILAGAVPREEETPVIFGFSLLGGDLCRASRGGPHHELLVRSWIDRRRLGGVAWLMIGVFMVPCPP